MSLKFEVKKKHVSRSERVKSVELHPELPWVLSALYSGNITIQDYTTQTIVKTIEVSANQSPVRNAKFVARKQWVVTVSDDHLIRVFNYNTNEKIKQFEGHSDYIRYVLIHPTQSYIMTCSDDTTIKMWDFENNFTLTRTFEDHVNYVMMLAFNPRDTNTFASASMDRTLKVWTLTNSKANFTLQGHEGGINCVDFHRGDKPYLISGGDDRLIKIWDYQTKQCIHTLEAHIQNISAAIFHPELPLIISTAEDGVIRFWHANTYKLENSINQNMERVWCLDVGKDNTLAFGFDEGTVVVKIGQDEPIVSFSQGKVVYGKNFEFFGINLKAVSGTLQDGGNVPTNDKELGISDIYPAGVRHSPNGHLLAIYSDSEYTICRSQNFKNCGFGQGTDLVWSPSGDYAIRETFSIKMFKNSVQSYELKTDYTIEQLFPGPLLAVRSSEFIIFYDWDTAKVIRRIDVVPKKVVWSENGTHVALATNEEVYFLRFFPEQMPMFLEKEEEPDGFEDAFEPSNDITESITSGIWIHDLFYYTTVAGKLAYTIGGKSFTVDSDKKAFIIGYLQTQNRLYLMDKNQTIQSYEVSSQVAEFQTLIYSNQTHEAEQLLSQIPEVYHDKLAKFLDTVQNKKLAYQLVKDADHKFDLALQLGLVEDAFKIAQTTQDVIKLRQVGDLALNQGRIKLAVKSLEAADDLGGLLLIYSSLGLKEALLQLGQRALDQTKMNIAFTAFFTCSHLEKCLEVLIKSNRMPEAAFFARTYLPSKITEIVKLWKESLAKTHPVIAQKIADPFDYQTQDLNIALQVEQVVQQQRESLNVPADKYQEFQALVNQDLFNILKEQPDYDLSKFTFTQQ